MAEQNADIISNLREKIQKVITAIEEVKGENKQLKEENIQLKTKIDTQEKELDDKKEKLETLRLAKSVVSSSEDSHNAKIQINKIVREIDKCIALLNR